MSELETKLDDIHSGDNTESITPDYVVIYSKEPIFNVDTQYGRSGLESIDIGEEI